MAVGLSYPSLGRRVNVDAAQRSQRSVGLVCVLTLLVGGCVFRLAQLQLVQGQSNRDLAEKNRIATVPIPSDRGNILDRHGKLLAANRISRSVYLTPRDQSLSQWQANATKLGEILNTPPAEIIGKLEKAGLRSAAPVRISRDISPDTFISLAEISAQIPGIEVRVESNRNYPYGSLAAHTIGYVGEATAEDLQKHPNYPMGMILGQIGIERIGDRALQGVWGGHQIEVDAAGKQLHQLEKKLPQSGSDLQLTLDLDLQKTAEKALGNRRGAVVVLDAKTGAVLALASGPTFDPNLFTRRISQKEWDRLQGQDQPFLNRALQGYPPASTFKIITTVAGLQSGKFSPDSMIGTAGAIDVGGTLFHEHGGGGYGTIGFAEALAVSSNTFFYQVGMRTGPEPIVEWAHRLGIGPTTTLGLDGENHGYVPLPAEKEKLFGEPWYLGDTVSMAIGQGLVQVTPLEMAVMISAIANGGNRVKPHLIAAQTNTPEMQPVPTGMSESTLAVVREGLLAVVKSGTGQQLNDGSIPLTAGKTGTAEVPGGGTNNALYVGYGPVKGAEIAIAVLVESGGYGAESAVPIAHQIYKAYFKSPSGRK
jgi:penicillin-binding protein 2